MTLIDNLNAINNCKVAIGKALKDKGVDMTGVEFKDYAAKIDALQLESGDAPSVDYIYSNAFLTGGTRKDIANLEAYEIKLDDNNTCEFRLTCAKEFTIYTGEDYDIVFAVEIPETYSIKKCVWLNEANNDEEMPQNLKANPRYSTIIRNGVTYNSFVRDVDGDMMNMGLNISDVKYILTIEKK